MSNSLELMKFFKYSKEEKAAIVVQLALDGIPMPDDYIMTQMEETLKLSEEDINKQFLQLMKYKMFPQLRK